MTPEATESPPHPRLGLGLPSNAHPTCIQRAARLRRAALIIPHPEPSALGPSSIPELGHITTSEALRMATGCPNPASLRPQFAARNR